MKEIDKIIKSTTPPKSKDVLWDNGKELLINRNGKWESTGGVAPMLNVKYAELVELRNNNKLIAGMQYRITDYVTTTAQENTRSAEHQFDVIVTADNKNTLNEVARACLHDGDTYFSEAGASLDAWKIWYSLDNNVIRFPWASVVKIEETIKSVGEIKLDFPIVGVYFDDIFYELPIGEEVYLSYGPPITATLLQGNVLKVSDTSGSTSNNHIVAVGFKEREGKGVIYRMIDEHNNDLPYDFKNIKYIKNSSFQYFQWGQTYEMSREASQDIVIGGEQYYCYKANRQPNGWEGKTCWIKDKEPITTTIMYKADGTEISYGGNIISVDAESGEYYTFCGIEGEDFSFNKDCFGNVIKTWKNGLNRIIFKNLKDGCYHNSFGNNCYNNSFRDSCYNNSFGHDCYNNFFGHDCYNNSFGNICHDNSFGNNCNHNSFGHSCDHNSFGNDCYFNSFSNGCYFNSFSSDCNHNSFSNDCNHNSFGNDCNHNSFGNNCNHNSFSNDCHYNSFSNYCNHNSLGNNCNYNSFGNSSQSNELKAYYRYITFGEGVQYVTLLNETEGSYNNQVQNYRVANGTHGEDGNPLVVDVTRNMGCETFIGMDSNDELKVFCLADLLNQ